MNDFHYNPPWADTSIIGIAGSSGSGKTSLSLAIVSALDLPWVVIISMDSFYKPLTPEQSAKAFQNDWDFDSPEAIDFDILVSILKDLKQGRRAEIPIYSFAKHQRQPETTAIYSPHVLILEGIFALHDPRVLDLLDMKIFAEADSDLCLARRITRDVRERGRDIEGCIKQWFKFVKPNYQKYVEPQRAGADIIVPRGIENKVAIDMVVKHIQRTLTEKSKRHQDDLLRLGKQVEDEPLSSNVLILKETPQLRGMHTILLNLATDRRDFIFYFDRLVTLLIERAMENFQFAPKTVITPLNIPYHGLTLPPTPFSAVVILRGGSTLETGLKRIIPDCLTGRLLIKTSYRTGEPELHFQKLPPDIASHAGVLLLDPQMSSGGAALMAVKVLVDHGVPEEKIVFVTCIAGKLGLKRLTKVFPRVRVVVCKVGKDGDDRWIERRYFGC